MTIIVEDGSVVTGANSYVSEADFSTYLSDRGLTVTGTASVLLHKAMDYIETVGFIGDKYSEDQPLQWPRENVYIDGYYIERTTIPADLIKAQTTLAYQISQGYDPLATIERSIKREKVDALEVEYMENATAAEIIRSLNAMLKKLVKGGGGMRVVRV